MGLLFSLGGGCKEGPVNKIQELERKNEQCF